jgi:COPI associated protein
MAKILKWSKFLRISMIVVSILCIITSWYNLAVSTNSVSTNFLAAYVFFFSMIICCYELALKQVAVLIVQNFGFMYNPFGRSIFLAFLAILLYQLSTMGKVMFAILIVMGIIQIYVDIRHPKFETYKRTMHFYNKASATKSSANPVVTMNPMSV